MGNGHVKLNREFFQEMIDAARKEQQRAQEIILKQQGTINLCEYILANGEFEKEGKSEG